MAEIVNFNKARKARELALAKQKAAENKAKHGQKKETKSLLRLQLEKAQRDLDGHRRDD